MEGDSKTAELAFLISSVEEKIRVQEQKNRDKEVELKSFSERAELELNAAKEDLARAQLQEKNAAALADATKRHLDSFMTSMKSIEAGLSGGLDPRNRFVEKKMVVEKPKGEVESLRKAKNAVPK